VAAEATDAELLGIAAGAPLLRERRRAVSGTGQPLEYGDDRYRPDVVTFTVENARDTAPAVLQGWRSSAAGAAGGGRA
jgi:GntR family transcriptional regulator